MKETADFLIKTIIGVGIGAGTGYVTSAFHLPFGSELISGLGVLAGVAVFLKAIGDFFAKKE